MLSENRAGRRTSAWLDERAARVRENKRVQRVLFIVDQSVELTLTGLVRKK